MITIEDNDAPITAAQKIIMGTKPYAPSPLTRVAVKALTGDESDADTIDMFSVEEIHEIAEYLLVYCRSHEDGD